MKFSKIITIWCNKINPSICLVSPLQNGVQWVCSMVPFSKVIKNSLTGPRFATGKLGFVWVSSLLLRQIGIGITQVLPLISFVSLANAAQSLEPDDPTPQTRQANFLKIKHWLLQADFKDQETV